MAQTTMQTKFKKIAALASKLERHIVDVRDREEYMNWTDKDRLLASIAQEIRSLSPEVRELLEMDA